MGSIMGSQNIMGSDYGSNINSDTDMIRCSVAIAIVQTIPYWRWTRKFSRKELRGSWYPVTDTTSLVVWYHAQKVLIPIINHRVLYCQEQPSLLLRPTPPRSPPRNTILPSQRGYKGRMSTSWSREKVSVQGYIRRRRWRGEAEQAADATQKEVKPESLKVAPPEAGKLVSSVVIWLHIPAGLIPRFFLPEPPSFETFSYLVTFCTETSYSEDYSLYIKRIQASGFSKWNFSPSSQIFFLPVWLWFLSSPGSLSFSTYLSVVYFAHLSNSKLQVALITGISEGF